MSELAVNVLIKLHKELKQDRSIKNNSFDAEARDLAIKRISSGIRLLSKQRSIPDESNAQIVDRHIEALNAALKINKAELECALNSEVTKITVQPIKIAKDFLREYSKEFV